MRSESWNLAVDLVAAFVKQPARLEHLLERVPSSWDMGRRRTVRSILAGTIRNLSLVEKACDKFLRKRPKPWLWAAFLVAANELRENPESQAKVVHHAVGEIGNRLSKTEKGLANAVLRKVATELGRLQELRVESAADLAWRYSHPLWLVTRWLDRYGLEATRSLLEWNQQEPALYVRWQRAPEEAEALVPVGDEGFFEVQTRAWPTIEKYLSEGRLYVQNPSGGVAPGLLASRFTKGRVMDLCAAPGGKSLLLSKLLRGRLEALLAVDLAGPRFDRMAGNFVRYEEKRIQALDADVFSLDPAQCGLFEGVLLDAPCSNFGVMQRKVDVRWRTSLKALEEVLGLQGRLLCKAATFVKTGGTLVYSTCSFDQDENEGIVSRFLDSEAGKGFELEASKVVYPWIDERDGAGAFVMRRKSD